MPETLAEKIATPEARHGTGILERLKVLTSDLSQAELARQTGTSEQKVSRYLRGAKIPLTFGSALTERMGVNPAWLALGEGTPYLSDVAGETVATASSLLELVSAMTAITNMELGSLAGKDRKRLQRELNESMTVYDRLREKLDSQTEEVFRQLIRDYSIALDANKLDRAEDILKATGQVARLCGNSPLSLNFINLKGIHQKLLGNHEQAVEYSRRVFQRYIAVAEEPDAAFCTLAHNLVAKLTGLGLVAEARRVCRATLEYAGEEQHGHASYHGLLLYGAWIDAELGDIHRALAQLADAFPKLSKADNEFGWLFRMHIELLAGLTVYQHAVALAPVLRDPITLWHHAVWLEDAEPLQSALGSIQESERRTEALSPRHYFYTVLVRSLLEAVEGRGPSALADLERALISEPLASAPHLFGRLFHCAHHAQVARVAGNLETARTKMMEADALLKGVSPDRTATILTRACHYRNALELIPAGSRSKTRRELRERARKFFNDHYARGYRCFRNCARTRE